METDLSAPSSIPRTQNAGTSSGGYGRARVQRPGGTTRSTGTNRTYHRRQHHQSKTSWSFKEKLLLQVILCGGLLGIVMIINLVDASWAKTASGWTKSQISQDTSVESLMDIAKNVGDFFTGILKEDKTIGGETVETGGDSVTNGEISGPASTFLSETYVPSVDSTRIDEDILNDINNREDPYGKN